MDDNASGEAWLEGEDGSRWPLDASCSIGRSPSNRIVLNDRRVSRRHAVVHRQDLDEYWLVDLGSGNGSFVNGLRVSLPARLSDGDAVMIGDLALVFRQVEDLTGDGPRSRHASMTVIEVRNAQCWMLVADIVGSTKLASEYEAAQWATLVGSWAGECRRIIELYGGAINKYLGDGFLAIWPAGRQPDEHVSGAVQALLDLQKSSKLPFRLALHVGEVSVGGGCSLGEDNLSGFELVLVFRMEKMAGGLGRSFLSSEAAAEKLAPFISLEHAGDHVVQGFIDSKPRRFFGLPTA